LRYVGSEKKESYRKEAKKKMDQNKGGRDERAVGGGKTVGDRV